MIAILTGFAWLRSYVLYNRLHGVGASSPANKSSCTRLTGYNRLGLTSLAHNPLGFFPYGGYDTGFVSGGKGTTDSGRYQFCALRTRWAGGQLGSGVAIPGVVYDPEPGVIPLPGEF